MGRNKKPRRADTPDLPTREDILAFLSETSGPVGKREIARAFNIKGNARIGLKRLLREMAEAGDIEGPRRKIRKPGDLPSVTVVLVDGIDPDGELTATPLEWDEAWGSPPPIVIAR
ncbi:MAG TPA: ribonuclease R, partial [Afifellaceae bacterium]|nr:ribonuclease R [Afifellaceae bacterium]